MAVSDFTSHDLLPDGSISRADLQFTVKYNCDLTVGFQRNNYYEAGHDFRIVVNAETLYSQTEAATLWHQGVGDGTCERKTATDEPTTPYGSSPVWYTLSASDVTSSGIAFDVSFEVEIDLKVNGAGSWTNVISETVTITEVAGNPTKATNPTPADDATEVDFSGFQLSWTDGGGSDTFNVYIGETGSLTSVSSGQTGTTYTTTLTELETIFGVSPIDQKIYWRIDSSNDNGTTTGDEWDFDARPGQASSPSPTDESTGENAGLSITWTTGTNATTDIVNGGLTGNIGELETGNESGTYAWDLDWGYVYQWRIDSVNQFGTTTGTVWSFTTVWFDPPISVWENLPGKTKVPIRAEGETVGEEGVDYRWLGTNNMSTVKRLVVAADFAIWYEDR